MGETTAHVQAEFEHYPGEAFYGLGAHQNGLMNYADRDVDMYQLNTVDVVPFLVSSRGYGLLWDNTSHTKFGDRREPVHVPAESLYDADGRPGGLTGTYRQGSCETGSVVATRVDPQIAFGAPEDRPAISQVHNAPQVANAALHPKLAQGEACVTWDGQIEFGAAGPYDLMTFAEQRRAALARRAPGLRHLAAGLAAVVGLDTARDGLAARAPQAAPRVAPRRGRGHAAAQVEDAAALALHLALVRGRRRDRLLRRLRPRARRRRRGLSQADRPGAAHAALGARPLAEP